MTTTDFLLRYKLPMMAPDDKSGAGDGGTVDDKTPAGDAGDTGGDRGGDGGADRGDGAGEKKSLREQIRENMDAAGRESGDDREARLREARGLDGVVDKKPDDKKPADTKSPDDKGDKKPDAVAERDKLPASLGKDEAAKAAWANADPAIKAAFHRREEEMARGVGEIRARYGEIDKAMEPYAEAIRRNGHTPGAAVRQLFAWMDVLSQNPKEGFPALARSFNFDLATLGVAASPAADVVAGDKKDPAAAAAAAPAAITMSQLPKEIQDLLNVKTDVDKIKEAQDIQLQKDTEVAVTAWAKDKPYFERVRQEMGRLIKQGVVPLTQSGIVDLDWAYEQAVWGNKDLRAEILAAQDKAKTDAAAAAKEAERKAQTDNASRARKASGGALTPGAPGPGTGKKTDNKKMSVRESLNAAIAEVRDR